MDYSSDISSPSPVLGCVQGQFSGLATTVAALVHGEKIVVWLSTVVGLVQPSGQAVSHAVGRNTILVHKLNDIVVTLTVVL